MNPSRPRIKLIFELTNLCNFRCVHCIRAEGGEAQFIPVPVVEKVLEEARAYANISYVSLTGGEPTIHPRFPEIIASIVYRGYRFGFVTNGWFFVDRTFPQIEPTLPSLEVVTFSIDGATATTHDELRKQAGSFERLMRSIALCKSKGVRFHINFVVTRSNVAELRDVAVLASELGCEGLYVGHCQPTPDAVSAGLVLNGLERRQVEGKVARLQGEYEMTILLAGDHFSPSLFSQCDQLRMQEFNIDYRGYLTACCTLSNYRGGAPDTDIVSDLKTESLLDGHKKLVARVAEINRAKIDLMDSGTATLTDQFLCSLCLQQYGKVHDLRAILESTTLVSSTA